MACFKGKVRFIGGANGGGEGVKLSDFAGNAVKYPAEPEDLE